jgi:hypothetical protein
MGVKDSSKKARHGVKGQETERAPTAQHGVFGRSLRVYHTATQASRHGKLSDSLCACGNINVPAAHKEKREELSLLCGHALNCLLTD